MKGTKYLFSIIKPYKNEDINKIMIKSGLIRKISSGLYAWLPTGKKIINKISILLKNYMNKLNAMEMDIPILQPEYIWKENNKIYYNKEIMFSICKNNKFILSPTNEEIITFIIKNELNLKKLPIIVFQIQNKFRNEIRPRAGIIRTKEFLMKDAYSFHKSINSLNYTYNKIIKTYFNIFNKLKLNFYLVKGNSDFIGNKKSHEFHVTSKYGDNLIVICKKTNRAEILKSSNKIYHNHRLIPKENIRSIYFKNYLNNDIINKYILKDKFIKVLICYSNKYEESNFIALVLRFNDEICHKKIKKIKNILYPIKFINKEDIIKIFGCPINYIGIFNLNIPMIIDYNVALMSDFITTDNINNKFIFGVNWGKDINLREINDITNNNNKNNFLEIKRSIEIGHIFKLYDIYTKNIKSLYINKKPLLMGSYGLGLSRIIFSIIENNSKNDGIKWPYIICPFDISILPININNILIKNYSEKLYNNLKNTFDILFDDRLNKSFGSMFKDLDILGIPIIIIISEDNIKSDFIEIKIRNEKELIKINKKLIIPYLKNKLNTNKNQ